MTGQLGVERVALRAALGEVTYAEIETLLGLLTALESRGVLGEDGVSAVIHALADDIVTQKVLREFGSDLSRGSAVTDTPTPEEPPA